MTDKERLILIVNELRLPRGQWVLCGSGVMVMHGLRDHRPMGDIDIFIATRPWFTILSKAAIEGWRIFTTDPTDYKRRADPPYLYRDMHGIEVNIFFDWRRRGVGDLDINLLILNAEEIEGVPCAPLQMLYDWKKSTGRAKDVDDVAVLREVVGTP